MVFERLKVAYFSPWFNEKHCRKNARWRNQDIFNPYNSGLCIVVTLYLLTFLYYVEIYGFLFYFIVIISFIISCYRSSFLLLSFINTSFFLIANFCWFFLLCKKLCKFIILFYAQWFLYRNYIKNFFILSLLVIIIRFTVVNKLKK